MDWSYPLRAACERTPRRPALRFRGTTTTFGELELRVAALAGGLAAAGYGGRTVAWSLGNVPEAIELSLALARIGALSVPVNTRLTDGETAWILADADAEVLVVADAARGQRLSGPELVLDLDVLRDDAGHEPEPVADDAPATLLYTSGTTGTPKGVVRTHRANAWNVVNSALGAPRTVDDVELFNLPSFGIGLLHFALPALLGGATVVLDETFSAPRVWRLLAEERVTRTFLAPTMLSALLEVTGHETVALPWLHTIFTAYEFPERLRGRALERFGEVFVHMYGLTEAQLTTQRPGDFTAKPGSVGTAMGVCRIRVLDDRDGPAAVGTVGEIAFEGPSTMTAYRGQAPPDDGWVRTGDLGRLDADGDLFYVGRAKEMIKTGGFSVDPFEVEEALRAIPGVDAAAVVGVPDDHWGEMVVAWVVAPGIDPAAVVAGCRARLSTFKVPKAVELLDALPINASGKVERGRLRESFGTAPRPPLG